MANLQSNWDMPMDGGGGAMGKANPVSNAGQNERSDKSPKGVFPTFSAPSINVPQGGGSVKPIDQKFMVNAASGTGTMQIPLPATSGRHGFGPSLTLSYNSGAGNGPFGLGWQVDVGSISRKFDKGWPRYGEGDGEDDVFVLTGAEDLVPVLKKDPLTGEAIQMEGSYVIDEAEQDGFMVRKFVPRVHNSQMRIERWTSLVDPEDIHWRTISGSNTTTLYGYDDESRICSPSGPGPKKIFSWLACESYDNVGSAIWNRYKAENSENVPLDSAREANRGDNGRTANRYLKRIYYGNKTPNRTIDGTVIRVSENPQNDWMFSIVFDYGEHDLANPDYTGTGLWKCRTDPFSTHQAGFEVRTYRLCRRIMMFHHFPEETKVSNLLVSYTTLEFSETNTFSYLKRVKRTGCARDGFSLREKSFPPLEMSYSQPSAIGNGEVQMVDSESMRNVAGSLNTRFQFVDLNGEGLPGILYEELGEWYYKRNCSANNLSADLVKPSVVPRFDEIRQVVAKPNVALANNARIADVDGDGVPDLVVKQGPTLGYCGHDPSGEWRAFEPFQSFPIVNLEDPNVRMIDLTGDGFADIFITTDSIYTLYTSVGTKGFAAAEQILTALDENVGPRVLFSDPTSMVAMARFSGSGLPDIVLIRNCQICYWPSLGYGRFGRKVIMDNAPAFDDNVSFNHKYLHIGDIYGSGFDDLIYTGNAGAVAYINHAGNSWSGGLPITQFPPVDSVTTVAVADLFGRGTACLLWSSSHEICDFNSLRFIDLAGAQKPNLLTNIVGNGGMESEIHYAPSTQFYLQDEEEGTPWITKLPFPVWCVESTTAVDRISQTTFSTKYRYHHGFYDAFEREFRGFGMVEQWDANEFGSSSVETAQFTSPPSHTKTWFHTGCFLFDSTVSQQMAHGYFAAPKISDPGWTQFLESLLPDSVITRQGLFSTELRSAYRALKGSTLRTEVYADDGTTQSHLPFEVTEQNATVGFDQPQQSDKLPATFRVNPRETIHYYYERNTEDPRIQHELTLEVDAFGNVSKSATVTYGRALGKSGLQASWKSKQEQTVMLYSEVSYTAPIDGPATLTNPVMCESFRYEIQGLKRAGTRFSVSDFASNDFEAIKALADVPYETVPDPSKPSKRLLSRERSTFRSNDLSKVLPLGVTESRLLPARSYKISLSLNQIQSTFIDSTSGRILFPNAAQALTGTGPDEGGFIDLNQDGNLWIPSGEFFYSLNATASSADELREAMQTFFTPKRYLSPFLVETRVFRDKYSLLVEAVDDDMGNRTSASYDYGRLSASQIIDPNGNRTLIAYDELGVRAIALSGKSSENVGDSLDNFRPFVPDTETNDLLANPSEEKARLLLGSATECNVGFPMRYFDEGKPLCSISIKRETHASEVDIGRVYLSIHYLDGLGRSIQGRVGAEPGPLQEGGATVSQRWNVSGTEVYDNKGRTVQKFEPYFDDTWEFSLSKKEGVSSTIFYDTLGRPVGKLQPNHGWEKTIISPWSQTIWDIVDTVLISDPRSDEDVGGYFKKLNMDAFLPSWYDARKSGGMGRLELDAAMKCAANAATPMETQLDSQGRAFLTIADNGAAGKYTAHLDIDVLGRTTVSYDAIDRQVLRNTYSCLGELLHQVDMDTGNRWMISDCEGKILMSWNSRGIRTRHSYDLLRRPYQVFVQEENGPEVLAQRILYGDSQPNPEMHNLRGKTYRSFDQSGIVTNDSYDFKGNALHTSRHLSKQYKGIVDWNTEPAIEEASYEMTWKFNALNKTVELTTADQSNFRYRFNQAGLLDGLDVQIRGETANSQAVFNSYVTSMDYNARGQRTRISYGNGTTSTNTFDQNTFRLLSLVTKSGAKTIQALRFTSEISGRITNITDEAQQTLFFRNTVVDPSVSYNYDAIGRLVEATGREHLGQTRGEAPEPETGTLSQGYSTGPYQPEDGNAMALYKESFSYDAANNITAVKHEGSDARNPGWTRNYTYTEPSKVSAGVFGNLLSSTRTGSTVAAFHYEGSLGKHGLPTSMAHLPSMTWDYSDRLQSTSTQSVTNGGTPETTYYVYDAQGNRIRKVVETQSAAGQDAIRGKETVYLAGLEIFRKFNGTGQNATFERQILKINDSSDQIATIETRVLGNEPGVPSRLTKYQICTNLKSVRVEVDENGDVVSYEEYSAYGSTTYRSTNVTKRFRFSGKELDTETGLYYFDARYYAPWLGRWISADPNGHSDGLNLFSFVHNNPAGLVDLSGGEGADPEQQGEAPSRWTVFKDSFVHGAVERAKEYATPLGVIGVGIGLVAFWAVTTATAPLWLAVAGAVVIGAGLGILIGSIARATTDFIQDPSIQNTKRLGEVAGGTATDVAVSIALSQGPKAGGMLKGGIKSLGESISRLKLNLGESAVTPDGIRVPVPDVPQPKPADPLQMSGSKGPTGKGSVSPKGSTAQGPPTPKPPTNPPSGLLAADRARIAILKDLLDRNIARILDAVQRGDLDYLKAMIPKSESGGPGRQVYVDMLAEGEMPRASFGQVLQDLLWHSIQSHAELRGRVHYTAFLKDQSSYWGGRIVKGQIDFFLLSEKGKWIRIELTTVEQLGAHAEKGGAYSKPMIWLTYTISE